MSIDGVLSGSTRVAVARLDSVEMDVCSTGWSEAGVPEATARSIDVSEMVLATVASRGGSCSGGGTRVGCVPGGKLSSRGPRVDPSSPPRQEGGLRLSGDRVPDPQVDGRLWRVG